MLSDGYFERDDDLGNKFPDVPFVYSWKVL